MGLIKAAFGAVGGVMADQWKEFFYPEMPFPAGAVHRCGSNRVKYGSYQQGSFPQQGLIVPLPTVFFFQCSI